MLTWLQAFSASVDGAAALLDCSANVTAALVQTLQHSVSEPSRPAASAAMQCLANLTQTQRGVRAALQANLPPALTATVKQVAAFKTHTSWLSLSAEAEMTLLHAAMHQMECSFQRVLKFACFKHHC